MKKSTNFSPGGRERAIRLVQEHRGESPSLWAAVGSIASKIGCNQSTLLKWVKHDGVDGGKRVGVSTADREHLEALARENKELRRANEILKLASAFLPRPSSTAG